MAKMRDGYRYSISTHSLEDVLILLEQLGRPLGVGGPQMLYCDTEGVCMFDDPEKEYIDALQALLNQQAAGGKRLVQLLFRPRQMIAVWEERIGEG